MSYTLSPHEVWDLLTHVTEGQVDNQQLITTTSYVPVEMDYEPQTVDPNIPWQCVQTTDASGHAVIYGYVTGMLSMKMFDGASTDTSHFKHTPTPNSYVIDIFEYTKLRLQAPHVFETVVRFMNDFFPFVKLSIEQTFTSVPWKDNRTLTLPQDHLLVSHNDDTISYPYTINDIIRYISSTEDDSLTIQLIHANKVREVFCTGQNGGTRKRLPSPLHLTAQATREKTC